MFGRRLLLARKRAGVSQRSLVRRMAVPVTVQGISQYENGQMLPCSSVLVALAQALDVSLDFLMSERVGTLDGLELRTPCRAPARDRAQAEATLIDHLDRYLAIEEILGLAAAGDPFESRRCHSLTSESQIEEAADGLREAWHLGSGAVPSLCELLEAKGLKVVEEDLPESIHGMACRVLRGGEPVAAAVLVSRRVGVERKRFTLARELARRVIRSSGNPAIQRETARHHFAGAFLVPRQSLLEAAGERRRRISCYELTRLKRAFGVSAAVMLDRLGQVGALSQGTVARAFRTYARGWRKADPRPIAAGCGFAAFEKPRRLRRLVLRAVVEELISPVRAATLLNAPLDWVERQITGPLRAVTRSCSGHVRPERPPQREPAG